MRYERDAAKNAENRRKHDVSLADGITALRDPERLERIDDRFAYGEERIATLDLSGPRVLFVVHTMLATDVCLVIFVRRATRRNRATFHQRDPRTF